MLVGDMETHDIKVLIGDVMERKFENLAPIVNPSLPPTEESAGFAKAAAEPLRHPADGRVVTADHLAAALAPLQEQLAQLTTLVSRLQQQRQ